MKKITRETKFLGSNIFVIVTVISTFFYSPDKTFSIVVTLLNNAFITMAILFFYAMYCDYKNSGHNFLKWLKEPF
jgi:hypothetical protein